MIGQVELKTLIPSLVASGVLLYEAITGNSVSDSAAQALTNGILIGAGYMLSLWGIWKNHQKSKPPTRSVGLTAEQAKSQTTNIANMETPNAPQAPIVTQSDLNNQLQK